MKKTLRDKVEDTKCFHIVGMLKGFQNHRKVREGMERLSIWGVEDGEDDAWPT